MPFSPMARPPAAGAFGWVQHARNKQTGEEVAVKFIELGPVRRPGGQAAEREAQPCQQH